MRIALGLLAAALAGEEGPPAPKPEAPVVAFQVRVLEMEGLHWRESIYFRLTPVGRQGTAAVWTTSRGIARSLAKQADRVVTAPRILAQPGATAVINTGNHCRFVADLLRQADGPVNRASAVAFQPEAQEIREGFSASLSGRAEPQGMRVRLSLDDTRVVSIHEVKLTECVRDEEGVESYLRPALQVPEVVSAKVGGEWLIPQDGALVVSLGAQTVVDDERETVSIRERLVIVEPEDIPATPAVGTASTAAVKRAVFVPMMPPMVVGPAPPLVITLPDVRSLMLLGQDRAPAPPPPAAVAASRLMPPTPARSLPPAFDPDGSPATLPPLPDDELMPVATDDETAEPRPSPQSRPAQGRPKAADASDRAESASSSTNTLKSTSASDPGVARADFNDLPQPVCCADADACPSASRFAPESFTVRIPLRGNRTIEVRATLSRTPDSRRPIRCDSEASR